MRSDSKKRRSFLTIPFPAGDVKSLAKELYGSRPLFWLGGSVRHLFELQHIPEGGKVLALLGSIKEDRQRHKPLPVKLLLQLLRHGRVAVGDDDGFVETVVDRLVQRGFGWRQQISGFPEREQRE